MKGNLKMASIMESAGTISQMAQWINLNIKKVMKYNLFQESTQMNEHFETRKITSMNYQFITSGMIYIRETA